MHTLYKSLVAGNLFEEDQTKRAKQVVKFYSEYRSILFRLKNKIESSEDRSLF